MIGLFDRLSRPFLRALDPEDAHGLAIKALRYMPVTRAAPDAPDLAVRAFGLNFPNPIGIAPGFDKNAQVPDALLRLGFNSEGAPSALARLAARAKEGGIVGVNIGANKDSSDRAEDYVRLIETFAPVTSYFTVNISSPNTPGLRDLQQADALDDLLARVVEAREEVKPRSGPTPVLLKIAPDLTLAELDDVVGIARKRRVDGMIVGNTTITRPAALREREKAKEQGGLSGRPLFKLATRMLAETFVRAEGAFPLIGVGGIDSGPTAIAKIKAGATLLQMYTGLVFRGIGLVTEIKSDLAAALKRGHRESLAAMVGADAAEITAETWPG